MLKIAALLTIIITLASCAVIKKSSVTDTERKLTAAGFNMEHADSEEKITDLKTIKQHKLIPHKRGSLVYYLYADAEFCKCLYTGSNEAYQSFLDLVDQENNEQMYDNEEDAIFLRSWGIYGHGC